MSTSSAQWYLCAFVWPLSPFRWLGNLTQEQSQGERWYILYISFLSWLWDLVFLVLYIVQCLKIVGKFILFIVKVIYSVVGYVEQAYNKLLCQGHRWKLRDLFYDHKIWCIVCSCQNSMTNISTFFKKLLNCSELYSQLGKKWCSNTLELNDA